MANGNPQERKAALEYIRTRDREAAQALSQSRFRTLKAARSAIQQLERENRSGSRQFTRALRSYGNPPPRGKFALTAVSRRGVKLSADGTSPGPGVRTVHFRLNQTGSGEAARRHQNYIEREGACAASFGTISPEKEERTRFWKAIHAKTISRKGSIRLQPETPLALKRALLERLPEILDSMELSEGEQKRFQYLARADDTTLAQADLTLRTTGGDQHRKWLRFLCLSHQEILEQKGDSSDPSAVPTEAEMQEMDDAQKSPAAKKYTAWTPPGVRERKPRDGIVQRRIVLELPHEISLPAMEHAVSAWCRTNLGDVSWHACIHRPENANDPRNWHAHIVYSQFLAVPRVKSQGWTFEAPGASLPENSKTIKILTGNLPPEEWQDPAKKPGRKESKDRTRRQLKEFRNSLCRIFNAELRSVESETRYDPRSYKDMGITQEAGKHAGPQSSGAAARGRDHSWHGYAHTWEQARESDSEDRGRLLAALKTSGQNFAHEILGRVWPRRELDDEDREWDRILAEQDQLDTERAKTSQKSRVPDWVQNWERVRASRKVGEDPLKMGLAAHRISLAHPELERLGHRMRNTGHVDVLKDSQIPETFRENAQALCVQAGHWRSASQAWQRPAERILQALQEDPGPESDLLAAQFLEAAEEAGVPETALNLLLVRQHELEKILVAGQKGRRRMAAERDILPAFQDAQELRYRKHVRMVLHPLMEKHERHLKHDHPRRGAILAVRMAQIENLAGFREFWDAGKIQELTALPWFRETRKLLSKSERQAFDQTQKSLLEKTRRSEAEKATAQKQWQDFRKLGLRTDLSEDERLSRLLPSEPFDTAILSRDNPRAGRVVELAHKFRTEKTNSLKELADRVLDTRSPKEARILAALEISGTWPKSTAILGVQSERHQDLSKELGVLTRSWAASLAQDVSLSPESDLPESSLSGILPSTENTGILEDERGPEGHVFLPGIDPEPKIPEKEEIRRARAWEIQRRYGPHSQAAASLCPFEAPLLERWLDEAKRADLELREKTGTLLQREETANSTGNEFEWRGTCTAHELARLSVLEPGTARRIRRLLGGLRDSDLRNLAPKEDSLENSLSAQG